MDKEIKYLLEAQKDRTGNRIIVKIKVKDFD